MRRIILQHLPDLVDENRQASIRHETVRPQMLMEFGLRKGALVMFGQQPEEIECFRGDRHRVAAAQQNTAVGIERPRIEGQTQN